MDLRRYNFLSFSPSVDYRMDYGLKGGRDSPPVDHGVVHTVGLREQEHVAVGTGGGGFSLQTLRNCWSEIMGGSSIDIWKKVVVHLSYHMCIIYSPRLVADQN